MLPRKPLIVVTLAVVITATAGADDRTRQIDPALLRTEPGTGLLSDVPSRLDLGARAWASSLRIDHVRLEAPPPRVPLPSAVLKFDVLNESSNRLTDLVLEVSILEKRAVTDSPRQPRVLVGPFTVRGGVVLESGYTVNYELLLHNFSSDCDCVANVEALSARSVPAEPRDHTSHTLTSQR